MRFPTWAEHWARGFTYISPDPHHCPAREVLLFYTTQEETEAHGEAKGPATL